MLFLQDGQNLAVDEIERVHHREYAQRVIPVRRPGRFIGVGLRFHGLTFSDQAKLEFKVKCL